MRRSLSILLILLFSLGPLAATLDASDGARLPACCRRHGAHRCVLSMGMAAMSAEAASGTPVFTAPSTCPAFPRAIAATATGPQALAASPVRLPALLTQAHSAAANRAGACLSQVRTRAGRGPPASILA